MHAKDKADPIPLALKQKQIRRGFVLQVDCVCVDPVCRPRTDFSAKLYMTYTRQEPYL